jgi:hypothetical protein
VCSSDLWNCLPPFALVIVGDDKGKMHYFTAVHLSERNMMDKMLLAELTQQAMVMSGYLDLAHAIVDGESA